MHKKRLIFGIIEMIENIEQNTMDELKTDISKIELQDAWDERVVTMHFEGTMDLERAQKYFKERRDLIVTKEILNSLFWRLARKWGCFF
jgi:hypothetical protein